MVKKIDDEDRLRVIEELANFWRTWGETILQYGMIPDGSTGVGGNTFRAYGKFKTKQKKKLKPSAIFRDWVSTQLPELNVEKSTSFSALHEKAQVSLVQFWKTHAKRKLPPNPYGAKLIDLHFKHIAWHPTGRISVERRQQFLNEVYQPLDKYSLRILRRCGIKRAKGRKIPSTASMGIVSEAEYGHFQRAIATICNEAGVPVFAFDQYAWNRRNPDD